MNFDYATVQSGVAALFGTNQDIGKGIADILVDKLVNDGTYSVIERKQLDKILAEQNFSNSDRADPNSAAKIARILGVDAIIIGSITQFGRDDKSTNVGGGAAGGALGRFGIGGVKTTQVHRRVPDHRAHDRHLYRGDPGQSSRQGRRDAQRHRHPRRGGSYAAIGGGRARHEELQLRRHHPRRGRQQGRRRTWPRQLDRRPARCPRAVKAVAIDGLVADVSPDGTLIINVGSKGGVKVGDTLAVNRKVREVRDPATGKVHPQRGGQRRRARRSPKSTSSPPVGKFTGAGAGQGRRHRVQREIGNA